LDLKRYTPFPITHSKAASGLQTFPGGYLIFSQSSLTSPNDVFVIRHLKALEAAISSGDSVELATVKLARITNFSEADLKDKSLSEGEEFWFRGALDKQVQGWALKPTGWKEGEKKKWPVVLLIHGGASKFMYYACYLF
jgi:dipeptidyl aminopeptidase/acylaminoacyl peptidase